MSKLIPLVFKKSLIAIAVASISACAAMPQSTDGESDGLGGDIVRAGQSVADVGLSAWHKTTRFLGFRDADDTQNVGDRADAELLARQNLEQAEPSSQNGVILQPADKEQPVIIKQAEAPVARLPLDESADNNDAQQLSDTGDGTLELADSNLSDSNNTESVLDETELVDTQNVDEDSENASLFALNQPLSSDAEQGEDLIHTVGDSETLWEIAKRTTGNANNWHTLADINDLTQSATVFPGQELIIPANLVKPGYPDAAPTLEVADQTQQDINVIDSDTSEDLLEAANKLLAANEELAPEIAAALPEESVLPEVGETAQTVAISANATPIELNEGETLWDFARRTTGDATNWKAIAAQNNFTEKQAVTVRPGQTIFVPQNLIKNDENSSAAIEKAQDPDSQAALLPASDNARSLATDTQLADVDLEETTEITSLATSDTLEETTELTSLATADMLKETTEVTGLATANTLKETNEVAGLATADALKDAAEAADVTTTSTLEATSEVTGLASVNAVEQTSEATAMAAADSNEFESSEVIKTAYQSTDAITPSNSVESEALQVIAENDSSPDAVRVSGTYYPKAVYNNADFSSSLLMRVSPGTTLQVSRLMGSWVEVETDKGTGYVHQRDIQIR